MEVVSDWWAAAAHRVHVKQSMPRVQARGVLLHHPKGMELAEREARTQGQPERDLNQRLWRMCLAEPWVIKWNIQF